MNEMDLDLVFDLFLLICVVGATMIFLLTRKVIGNVFSSFRSKKSFFIISCSILPLLTQPICDVGNARMGTCHLAGHVT